MSSLTFVGVTSSGWRGYTVDLQEPYGEYTPSTQYTMPSDHTYPN